MRKNREKLQVAENTSNKILAMSANRAYTLPVNRRTYKAEDVVALLKKRQGERSLRQFASDMEISAAYLSDIYHGRRRPGKSVLRHLGLTAQEPSEPVYVAS